MRRTRYVALLRGINVGADKTQVFSGSLTTTIAGDGSFDLVFPTSPFVFNPANGNLLLAARPRDCGMSRASLTHHYDDPKEALIAPHKFMALTHYYVDRWLPELGERGHVIVTVLRRMGYLDRDRDVERGGIEIEREDLAVLCGLKLRTLQREFANGKRPTRQPSPAPLCPARKAVPPQQRRTHRAGEDRLRRANEGPAAFE